MRSSILCMPKSEAEARKNVIRNNFLSILYRYGPWRIDVRVKDAKDQNEDDKFLAHYGLSLLPEKPASEFIYRRSDKLGFIFWQRQQKIDLANPPDLVNFWLTRQAVFAKMLPDFVCAALDNKPEMRLAQFSEIQNARQHLPASVADDYPGVCLNGSRPCWLYQHLSEYGYKVDKPYFSVWAFSIPAIQENTVALPAPGGIALSADYSRCRLGRLAPDLLTDNTQGHWDLYWPKGSQPAEKWYAGITLPEQGEGRDPARDIRTDSVAIDFGTASTVVAMRNASGKIYLSRIGVAEADLARPVEAKHYENPTVLLFDNIQKMLAAWQGAPWRPKLDWADSKCSQQAAAELKNNIGSGLTGLKSWARTKPDEEPLALRDKPGFELFISRTAGLPGSDIEADFEAAPFNPVELYAWYIGLHLNNQAIEGGRIYTDYYLSFPPSFERPTREFILASFRRGLLRSLPPSLIYASNWDPAQLQVSEGANEPAAYAAAALPLLDLDKAALILPGNRQIAHTLAYVGKSLSRPSPDPEIQKCFGMLVQTVNKSQPKFGDFLEKFLKEQNEENLHIFIERLIKEIKRGKDPEIRKAWDNLITAVAALAKLEPAQGALTPDSDGICFGVFDFGGGTTDFAIGRYRLATSEEADEEDWEKVIEILQSSGDASLGGENLLAWLAFQVVCDNLDKLITEKHTIPFIKPDANLHVPGGEPLFGNGVIARANSHKLAQLLRAFWEKGEKMDQISETFSLSDSTAVQIELTCNHAKLENWLIERIGQGIDAFFNLARQAFKEIDRQPAEFHIILAGNSSKSGLLQTIFRQKAQAELEKRGENCEDRIFIHPPLLTSAANPEAVTLKTGVAIGILETLAGEKIGVVNRHSDVEEAPFQYCVGTLANECLSPRLLRNTPYGKWVEFGKVPGSGKIKALYSANPAAVDGTLRRGCGCLEVTLNLGSENKGKKIVVQAKTPTTALFALDLGDGKFGKELEIELKG